MYSYDTTPSSVLTVQCQLNKKTHLIMYQQLITNQQSAINYPEWPHRQGGCLAACGCTFESRLGCTDLYYARAAQGVLPMRVGGATSQLDLPSLTPLSVAGCG